MSPHRKQAATTTRRRARLGGRQAPPSSDVGPARRCTTIVHPLPSYRAATAWRQAKELWSMTEVLTHPEVLHQDPARRLAIAQACMTMAVYLGIAAEAIREWE